jgi:hypothetical protein
MPGSQSGAYRVVITDTYGTPYGEFENAVIESVTWELNGLGGCSFTMPTTDPKIGILRDLETQREVQIWRDPMDGTASVLIFWGPVVRSRANPLTVTFECMGLFWYFSRIILGPPLEDLVANSDFESGLTGWTATGATQSIDTTIVRRGVNSLQLVSADQGLDQFSAADEFTVIAPSTNGVEVRVAASFYLTATFGTPYIGPAYKERGLYVRRILGGVTQEEVWTPLANSAPRNQWVRIYAPLLATPASTTETYEVRLYSPGGMINWDCVTSRNFETLGVNTLADVTDIVHTVIVYAEDATQHKPGILNIDPPTGSIGVEVPYVVPLAAVGTVWSDFLQQIVSEGLCDVDITWNAAGTTREVQVYAKKGAVRPQLALVMGGNIGSFEVDKDGQSTASAVTVVGNNNQEPVLGTVLTPCLLFGFAADDSANGAITLGAVVNSSYETTISGLQSKAVTELARLKNPLKSLTVTTKENLAGSLIGVLTTGDVVPVVIDYGFVQENSSYRVVAMTLTPATETLAVTLNLDLPGANAISPVQLKLIQENATVSANLMRSLPPPPPALADLGQVAITGITDGQTIKYDQSSGLFIPTTPGGVAYGVFEAASPGAVTYTAGPFPEMPGVSEKWETTFSTIYTLYESTPLPSSVLLVSMSNYIGYAMAPSVDNVQLYVTAGAGGLPTMGYESLPWAQNSTLDTQVTLTAPSRLFPGFGTPGPLLVTFYAVQPVGSSLLGSGAFSLTSAASFVIAITGF